MFLLLNWLNELNMKKSKREDLLKSGWHFRSKFDRFARKTSEPKLAKVSKDKKLFQLVHLVI